MFPELFQKYYKIIIILIIIIYLLFIKKTNINISLKLLIILLSSILLLYFLIKILSLYENFTSPNKNVNETDDNLFRAINIQVVNNRSADSINRASAGFKKKSTTTITKYNRIIGSSANGDETGKSLKQRGTKRGDELNQTNDDKEGDTQDIKPASEITIKDRVIKSSKILYGDIKNDVSKEATTLIKNNKRGALDKNILTKLNGRQKTLGKKSSDFTIKKALDEDEETETKDYEGINDKFATNNIVVLQNDAEIVQ
jgi:hypothetical protein